MTMPRAAAIYARMSKDITGEGLGIERQLADCQAYAKDIGWVVADHYIDNDPSAYSGKPRPDYRRLLADINSGVCDGVIVFRADRLHRSPVELEEYIAICDRLGVQTRTVASGLFDLTTA